MLGLRWCFLLVLIACMWGCGSSDVSRTFRVSQVERLLAGETSKSWSRISRIENGTAITLGECEDEDVLVFNAPSTSNVLYSIGEAANCASGPTSPDTTINGTWVVDGNIDDFVTDTLIFTHQERTLNPRVIQFLTSNSLDLLYIDDTSGDEVIERYSF